MLVSIASGTIIPVHIAFIPILIPPLLAMMNQMKMDRRMLAICFGFGLKAPYITIPVAYGAIFQGIIKDSVNDAGLRIGLDIVWKTTWIAGLAMLFGLICGLIYYSKNREYRIDKENHEDFSDNSTSTILDIAFIVEKNSEILLIPYSVLNLFRNKYSVMEKFLHNLTREKFSKSLLSLQNI